MDDATIEDDIPADESISTKIQTKSNVVQLFDQQWISLIILSIVFFIFIYFYQKRKKNSNSQVDHHRDEDHLVNQYDQMAKIREKQQKAYEEQMQRLEEKKRERLENLAKNSPEESKPMKYRTNDSNPLSGQSNSCSWRPSSSSRRKPAGG